MFSSISLLSFLLPCILSLDPHHNHQKSPVCLLSYFCNRAQFIFTFIPLKPYLSVFFQLCLPNQPAILSHHHTVFCTLIATVLHPGSYYLASGWVLTNSFPVFLPPVSTLFWFYYIPSFCINLPSRLIQSRSQVLCYSQVLKSLLINSSHVFNSSLPPLHQLNAHPAFKVQLNVLPSPRLSQHTLPPLNLY